MSCTCERCDTIGSEKEQEALSDVRNSMAARVRRCVDRGHVHGDATSDIYLVREICCPCEKREGRKHGEMLERYMCECASGVSRSQVDALNSST